MPIKRLESEMSTRLLSSLRELSSTERNAFLGWFVGGCSRVVKYANRDFVFFGKAECEWVPFDFWLTKLPALGFINIVEARRGIAKGMVGQPDFIEYKITATADGFAAREAWWDRPVGGDHNDHQTP